MFSGKEEHFNVWTKKIENCVSGVFPNVRDALAFEAESQDVVTSATVAIGLPDFGVETSAERDVTMASRVGARAILKISVFYPTRFFRQFWADPTFSAVRTLFWPKRRPQMLKFYPTQNFGHFWAALLKMSGFTTY